MTVEVYDLTGTRRDMAWLRERYGNVQVLDAGSVRKFALTRIDVTTGNALLKVRVLSDTAQAQAGQPVANCWPDSTLTLLTGQGLQTVWQPRAAVQKTDTNGFTGYGLGTGSYIQDLAAGGPHTVWVLSPSLPSDGVSGLGMLGGTNHEGPLFLTFAIQDAAVEPEPEPQPDQMLALMQAIANNTWQIERHLAALREHFGA